MRHAMVSPGSSINVASENGQDEARDSILETSINQQVMNIANLVEGETGLQEKESLRERIHLFCTDHNSSLLASVWRWTFTFLIFFSVAVYCFETMNKPSQVPGFPTDATYFALEVILTIIFVLEILVRLVAAPALWVRAPGNSANIDTPFFRDLLNYIDFVAISPLFLELIFQPPTDPHVLNLEFEIIKLLRVLRVFKIFRSFSGTRILLETAANSLPPLTLTLMMLFMFFTVVASIIFIVQPCTGTPTDEAPMALCTFTDALNAAYFVIITITTVGYGDQVPKVPVARFIAVVTMLFGAVFLSMPIAVIGNHFESAYKRMEERNAAKDPVKALQKARRDYQKRINTRRGRIAKGLFSLLYDIQHVQALIGASKAPPAVIEEDRVYRGEKEAHDTAPEDTPPTSTVNSSPGDTSTQSKYAVAEESSAPTGASQGKSSFKTSGRSRQILEATRSLARKHYFISVDISQLFRLSDEKTTQLTQRENSILKKITSPTLQGSEGSTTSESTTQVMRRGRVRALDVIEDFSSRNVALVALAKKSSFRRDKLWLCIEHPSSSRIAYTFYMSRWILLALGVIIAFAQTLPEANMYGPDSSYCTRLMVSYCKNIESSVSTKKEHWKAANPACFPATISELNATRGVKATSDYRGCLDTKDCHFPSAEHNMTCSSPGALFTSCDASPQACASRSDYRNSIFWVMKWKVPVCHRTPCVDNTVGYNNNPAESTGDYSQIWYAAELIFMLASLGEHTVRFLIRRSTRRFFRRNAVDCTLLFLIIVEYIIVVSTRQGGGKYDAWGFAPLDMLFDTHTMRPSRILAALRFCVFSTHFRGVRVAWMTCKQVAGRMTTPTLFFFVFMVIFAGAMYVFEVLECPAMQVPDNMGNLKWEFMTKDGSAECLVQDMFDAMWVVIVT